MPTEEEPEDHTDSNKSFGYIKKETPVEVLKG
ncbi:unnamed protein product, partial [marine sediment metagenome]